MLDGEKRKEKNVSINFIVSSWCVHFVAFSVNDGTVNVCFRAYGLKTLGKYLQSSNIYLISGHFLFFQVWLIYLFIYFWVAWWNSG